MAKLRTHPYYHTCGFHHTDGKYHCGLPLYVRERDRSLFIIFEGRRVDVALVNTHGTVILLTPAVKAVVQEGNVRVFGNGLTCSYPRHTGLAILESA